MTCKIDRTISKISGSSDYMSELAKITGNMNTIDKEMYIKVMKSIDTTYLNCILPQLTRYESMNTRIRTFIKKLEDAYKKIDINTLYTTKIHKKSGKQSTSIRIRPRDVYQSDWFKLLRELHNMCSDMVIQFNITSSELTEEQLKDITNNRDTVDTYTYFGMKITEPHVCTSINVCKRFIDDIVNKLLTPMYDCKSHIQRHWLPQIDTAVGIEVRKKTGKQSVTREEIQDYLYTFILAKYRLDVTGSPDQFTKVLFKQISEYDVMNMDPSRFLDVVEGFNIDSINGSAKLKSMAELAKTEMRKILSDNTLTPTDILRDINNILNEDSNEDSSKSGNEKHKQEPEGVDDVFN